MFEATCDARSICEVRTVSAVHAPTNPKVTGASPRFALGVWGRYHVLCDTWKYEDGREMSDILDEGSCRALACTTDADCIPAYGLPGVRCASGLCGDPTRPLGRMDVAVLCMSGTGSPQDTPMQKARAALVSNCGPCVQPSVCRAP